RAHRLHPDPGHRQAGHRARTQHRHRVQHGPVPVAAVSVSRVMGTEVEYGISVQGRPEANPMHASSQIVNAYANEQVSARRARWDFEEESPLRDARGFEMSRTTADPSQLTDEDGGLANVIL